jgi:NADPH2:quinone reductase
MRAWQVRKHGEPRDALQIVDAPVPQVPPGLLRVRVAACGVGLPDLFMCRGSYALTPALPFTPGQELVGAVTEAGEGAEMAVGQRVMAVSAFFLGHGGFAAEALALDEFAFAVPDDVADSAAAGFVIPYHTAYVGLVRRANLRAGETLLVLGAAGGTGSAAVQLGRAIGARVIATARGDERGAFCRELGAEVVVDHGKQDIAQAVRDATDGQGVDVVYDPVGGDAFKAATRCIAHEGRLLAVGFASGQWGRPDPAHLTMHNYSVLGVMPGGYDRAFKLRAQEALMGFLSRGEIRVPVHATLPFEALPQGLEDLAKGRAMGKIVLSTV